MSEQDSIPTKNKGCLKWLVIAALVLFLAIGAMAIIDICPPQGPWPTPPWCDGSEKPFYLNPQALTKLIPTPLSFTVQVPSNTPDHTVVYIEFFDEFDNEIGNTPLEKSGENEWVLSNNYFYNFLKEKGTLRYLYTRNHWGYTGGEEFEPDSPDTLRSISINDNLEVKDNVRKWRWIPEPDYVQPEVNARIIPFEPRINGESFHKGVVFADFWWGNFFPLIESTNARMKNHFIDWVELAPTWDYAQINPIPIISNQFSHSYPDESLRFHLDKLREDGLNIYFEPQVCCTSLDGADFSTEWWDAWFEQYQDYLLYHVDLANEYDIEYFVIGDDWFVMDQKPEGYMLRLTRVYETINERYEGKLGRKIYLGGSFKDNNHGLYPAVSDMPYMDQWDFIAVNFWAGISKTPDPTPEELDETVEEVFSSFLRPLYDQYKLPVILNSVAYASVDGCLMGTMEWDDPAIQMWEPYSTQYTLDLAEQAMGMDAILRGVANHDYIVGAYPFFYFPDTFPLSMEFNLRDKPAEEVISRWYQSIP